ncbi:hypothetical protein [Porphyromonas circumdentaria]|uniref:Uncharacterized protein n=2 Tax=Porphyromonas circumdentaria TaxID=29524 RepID=A0A1T4PWG1_9PORP|nr:hypothetical protein [Porphyromonas circumdentaria]MBB6276561.1 light-regulated signal transduction histidine kinase (bacteriophytochrome) [Porphyromonas circumdentaria]SJZ95561.1 hypothetical protein SAMN02745171_01603 [Porphyromonas circumdentaria]
MNEQMNILLELLEEIKQQNRDLKSTVTNLESTPNTASTEMQENRLLDLTKTAELLLENNVKWKKEFKESAVVLGKRIAEIKRRLLDSTKASNDAVAKFEEIQTKEAPPTVKNFYLLDTKRWIQWVVWG